VFVAVDEGVLVKTGPDVLVSVRRAIGGTDLGQLREAVEQEFLTLDEHEQSVRTVMAKLETGFLRRFATFNMSDEPKKPRRTKPTFAGRSARRRRASSRRGATPRRASGSAWA
jgi:hypothetical protein